MTPTQKRQFNVMLETLKKIAKAYQTPAQIRRGCGDEYGLGFEEAIEMAYENIQHDARQAVSGVRRAN